MKKKIKIGFYEHFSHSIPWQNNFTHSPTLWLFRIMVHSYVTSVTFSIFLSHTDSKLSFMALPPPVKSFIHLRVKSSEILSTQDFLTTYILTLLHSEWPKLHRVLAILSAIGLISLQSPLYYNAGIHNFPPFQRDTNFRAWHWKKPLL